MLKINTKEFISYCKNNLKLSKYTLLAYSQDLKNFNKFLAVQNQSKCSCQEILLNFQNYLSEEKQSAPSTTKRNFSTLRSYFNWLIEIGIIEKSPFDDIKLRLKVPKRLPKPVDRPTLKLLVDFSDKNELSNFTKNKINYDQYKITILIIKLLVHTGMRVGEVTNLCIEDITNNCTKISVKGKGDKERTVYITNHSLLREVLLIGILSGDLDKIRPFG